ncbi:MAG TPA: glycoside hydrolase family 3 N-terminal domain-containing protein [Acidimicrobiales bacterium]|nr:glycoside hydrolase family 3 N-terminal domain-containing protein [Acidimicrobiales bacterium]
MTAIAAACAGSGGTSAPTSAAPTTAQAIVSPTTASTAVRTTSSSACDPVSAVRAWPLARRAAQLVVAPALNGQIAALRGLVDQGVGGFVLLGTATPGDLAAQVAAANRVASVPLFVMADQEGGGVQRLGNLVPSLPWARQMAATMTPAEVESAAQRVGAAMLAVGVNVDLAPVVDVDGAPGPNARNPDGLRSFSADPVTAGSYATAFMRGLRSAGVLSVIKHFPGLGGASANTDYGSAETAPIDELRRSGLVPFRAAIASGAPAVMVSNAVVPGLATTPASLSPDVTALLRDELGFHGLLVTDSLSAGAIAAAGDAVARAAVVAIEAGADMVLFGSTLTAADTALLSPANVAQTAADIVDGVVAAAQSGALAEGRLDTAVMDVLAAKGAKPC